MIYTPHQWAQVSIVPTEVVYDPFRNHLMVTSDNPSQVSYICLNCQLPLNELTAHDNCEETVPSEARIHNQTALIEVPEPTN